MLCWTQFNLLNPSFAGIIVGQQALSKVFARYTFSGNGISLIDLRCLALTIHFSECGHLAGSSRPATCIRDWIMHISLATPGVQAMHEDRWQVLHVITNHEKKVAQHLTVRSLEHYLPLYTERSRWTDRVVSLERPLFSGYLFSPLPEARLSAIRIPGVVRMFGETERDTISEVEIGRIRESLASGCILRPHPGIALGARSECSGELSRAQRAS